MMNKTKLDPIKHNKKSSVKRERKTFKQTIINLLCEISEDEQQMKELFQTNPEMYQFILRISNQEKIKQAEKYLKRKESELKQ